MSKPETNFYRAVHSHLPPPTKLHREKMNNPYSSGTADFWYSGKKRDLWVEYKFIVVPRRADTLIDLVGGRKPALSNLQQDWIESRSKEGRDVWVIVGCTEGGVLMGRPSAWKRKWSAADFRAAMESRHELATLICVHTQGSR